MQPKVKNKAPSLFQHRPSSGTLPLFWATQNPGNAECDDRQMISAIIILPSEKLGQGDWKRAESGVLVGICRELDFVISSFLAHRHLPEAAVQN